MITLDKIKHEIHEILEKGCMTSECVKDLAMLYYLEEKMEHGHKKEHYEEHHGKLDHKTAAAWVHHMENQDGSVGEHFTMDHTNRMMEEHGWKCDPVEFWVAVNAAWSDGVETARRHGVDNEEYWADRGRDFLKDKDARPDKMARYYEYIVEHD